MTRCSVERTTWVCVYLCGRYPALKVSTDSVQCSRLLVYRFFNRPPFNTYTTNRRKNKLKNAASPLCLEGYRRRNEDVYLDTSPTHVYLEETLVQIQRMKGIPRKPSYLHCRGFSGSFQSQTDEKLQVTVENSRPPIIHIMSSVKRILVANTGGEGL